MRTIWLLTLGCLLSFKVFSMADTARFLSDPCLTPDGQTVIFSYEGDLWKAGVADGIATRLTAMPGYETDARVSPDGRWIAFTGTENGNADVFLIPVQGGSVKQLTWFSETDVVSSWSWDSRSVYFTSTRLGQASTFRVGIDGGTAVKVFPYYFFLNDHNVFENPTTGELFFNDTWESSNQVQRKHYKGPFNPDIQSYNPKTGTYKRYTDWIGKDFGATFDRKGNMYFISDQANGEYNLYTFAGDVKTPLTHFTSSIKNPIVNADGGKVVFEKDYRLWLYDITSGKASPLALSILRNDLLPKEMDFQTGGKISAIDLSPDGKKLAFVSRGELFVSDADGKFIRQIKREDTGAQPSGDPGAGTSGERVSEVKWLADNKTLLFNQTEGGFQNLCTAAADGSAPFRYLTHDLRNNREIKLNSKRTLAVYLSGRDQVRLIDLKTWENTLLVKDEIWGFANASPGFSPQDDYVVFTAYRNFEQDIFLHHLKTHRTLNLTHTAITETDPLFSPDGKYLYFVANLLQPAYPNGLRDPKIFRLPLEKWDEPFRSEKYDELFRETHKDSLAAKKDSAALAAGIRIDEDRPMDRIEQVGPRVGSQNLLSVQQSGEKTTLLYVSNQDEGKPALFKTVLEPFEEPKTSRIDGGEGGNVDITQSKDKVYILKDGSIFKLNVDGGKAEPVAINFTFRRNLTAEFAQMFDEAWARLDENYYDSTFHGLDWEKTRLYYRQFLPYVNNRADLRTLLNDMLGELNSSHQGFYTWGADETVPLKSASMETGILWKDDAPYTVQSVLRSSAADHADIHLREGDVLVAFNGQAVDSSRDRYYYFTLPSPDSELRLTFRRPGAGRFDVRIHPQASLYEDLYNRWIDNNQQRVDEKSNKRIAYSCMKDMGETSLDHFIIDMTQQLQDRDALILDLRYNTGGNVHDAVLDFLSRRSYLQWKYRGGRLARQPDFYPSDKPIILLTNEQSLSDAEVTSAGFKALHLGKIVGNETYHWIIFTSGAGLVDGSFIRLPSWGCYTLEGKDLEFSGVIPDIRVINTFADKINGKDPQLDAAIAEALKEMKP
jgi:tricorn protease